MTQVSHVSWIKDLEEFTEVVADNTNRTVLDKPALFSDDPIALSFASYRIWQQGVGRWADLSRVVATETDRRDSIALRNYYKGRYTFKALSGIKLSDFQKKTADFVDGRYQLKTNELGLLYRLPYFYFEDLDIDQIVANTNSANPIQTNEMTTHTLVPLSKVFTSRRSGDYHQFWFRTEDNSAAMMPIKSDNVLLPLFTSLFKQEKIQFRCYMKTKKLKSVPNRYYYHLYNLELGI